MSPHASAVAALTSWAAPDAEQAGLRTAYLAYLAERTDALSRSCRPAHLTASTIVLNPSADRTLLVLHAKLGFWVQPGGHCEAGDRSLRAAANREAIEETGVRDLAISAAPVRLSRHGAPCGAEEHFDVQYVGVVPDDAELSVSTESRDVRWFGVADLPDALAFDLPAGVAAAVRAASASAERGSGSATSSTRR